MSHSTFRYFYIQIQYVPENNIFGKDNSIYHLHMENKFLINCDRILV